MRNRTGPARLLHGRRKGRPLRRGQQALVDHLLPGLEIDLPAAGARIDGAGLFDFPPRRIWLEVGFGAGEHLADQARAHPDIGFIGCEPVINGVANLLSLIERDGLTNVRIFDDDARRLFAALPGAVFGRVFALYTDPWPKKRHHRRRFISDDTVETLIRLMKDDAQLRLASDHMGYVGWMLEHLTRCPQLVWRARSKRDWAEPPSDWVETRYEKKAKEKGLAAAYLCFTRRARAADGSAPTLENH